MRFILVICAVALLLTQRAWAQETPYPSLAALEKAEIPAYDFMDSIARLFGYRSSYKPPSSPPVYEIGDKESFGIIGNDGRADSSVTAELRGMTENVLVWVEESATFSRRNAQALAEQVETDILAPMRQFLDYRAPPGMDGDPRLTIFMLHQPGFWSDGYFDTSSLLPRDVNPRSNEREMLVVNLAYSDGGRIPPEQILATVAHEYHHNLLYFRDSDEEEWLDEALAVYFEYFVGGSDVIRHYMEVFLAAPQTGLGALFLGPELLAEYGAGGLFLIYLAEQYGDEFIARLHRESADGWRGIKRALGEYTETSADEAFADWALVNYFMAADLGYGYRELDAAGHAVQPTRTIVEFPAAHAGSLPQYSSEYLAVDVRGADKLALQLTLPPEARIIDAAPAEGEYFYYALTTAMSNSRLSRAFNLATGREIWLEYSVWFDLEEHYEYGYVEVSTDGGKTWEILPGEHTADENRHERLYLHGYTGNSGGWRQERIDLSDYVLRRILLRFETYTEVSSTYRGMAIDDLRIDAIRFHDGFETPDEDWVAEGWLRTDNRLPQRVWLQIAQETSDGLRLSRRLMSASGEVSVDLLPDVWSAHVAISPILPRNALPTEYALTLRLFDSAGAPMSAARSCRVRTTHGLNFRAAPHGEKIGLLPQGTTVPALNRRAGWFKVAYDGALGWISGDYVATRGNCV